MIDIWDDKWKHLSLIKTMRESCHLLRQGHIQLIHGDNTRMTFMILYMEKNHLPSQHQSSILEENCLEWEYSVEKVLWVYSQVQQAPWTGHIYCLNLVSAAEPSKNKNKKMGLYKKFFLQGTLWRLIMCKSKIYRITEIKKQ